MKGAGVDSTQEYILKENTPILQIKGSDIEDTGRKLVKGTVVKGLLKTRIVKMGDDKRGYKFIELKDGKGFISPQVVNIYIPTFANSVGDPKKADNTPVQDTAFGEKPKTLKTRAKNMVINYGLPALGAYAGYKIAERMGADTKKTVGLVIFFGLIGLIPRYISKK
jgi:hypothetical protein